MSPVTGALLLAMGVLLGGVPGLAAAPARSGETLKSQKNALTELRRQLEEARGRAAAARERETSLLTELGRVDRDLTAKRADLVQLDQRISRLEGELGRLTGRRGHVAEQTVAQQAALGTQIRALARLRAAPLAPDGMADGSAGELTGGVALARARAADDLRRVARLGARRLLAFEETAGELQRREVAVSRGRRELVDLRGKVDAQRVAMNRQAAERRRLLAGVRDDRATQEKVAGDLEDAARRLESLVRELSRRAQARPVVTRPTAPALSSAPAVGLGLLRGRLPWPTDGHIVAGFGRQIHPRFGTETVRRGVDIEAEEGTPVRAVSAATVLYRGWLKGYGNLIILDHGEGYYTLYAHTADVLADEGDQVKAGQPIARVGETGSVEGPRLYFEVRYQGRAEDPQIWLQRRP